MEEVFTPKDVVDFTNELLAALGSPVTIYRSSVFTKETEIDTEHRFDKLVANPVFEYKCPAPAPHKNPKMRLDVEASKYEWQIEIGLTCLTKGETYSLGLCNIIDEKIMPDVDAFMGARGFKMSDFSSDRVMGYSKAAYVKAAEEKNQVPDCEKSCSCYFAQKNNYGL